MQRYAIHEDMQRFSQRKLIELNWLVTEMYHNIKKLQYLKINK